MSFHLHCGFECELVCRRVVLHFIGDLSLGEFGLANFARTCTHLNPFQLTPILDMFGRVQLHTTLSNAIRLETRQGTPLTCLGQSKLHRMFCNNSVSTTEKIDAGRWLGNLRWYEYPSKTIIRTRYFWIGDVEKREVLYITHICHDFDIKAANNKTLTSICKRDVAVTPMGDPLI